MWQVISCSGEVIIDNLLTFLHITIGVEQTKKAKTTEEEPTENISEVIVASDIQAV